MEYYNSNQFVKRVDEPVQWAHNSSSTGRKACLRSIEYLDKAWDLYGSFRRNAQVININMSCYHHRYTAL